MNDKNKKDSKKINLAIIISLSALFISFIQLIITSPFFLDIYNKPKIIIEGGENAVFVPSKFISTNYNIENISNKTAFNLELSIDLYDIKSINFTPKNAFILTDSTTYSPLKQFIFKKYNLVPGEQVHVSFFTHLDTLKKHIGADSICVGVIYNCQELVPHITQLKSDLGFAKLKKNDSYEINAYKMEVVGKYKLKGKVKKE